MDEGRETAEWYHKPWEVLVFLFLVFGPFALPLLWKSPKFNKFWKALLSLVMIPYTAYLVYATLDAVRRLPETMAQVRALLG